MEERIKVTELKPYLYLLDDAGESTGYLVIGNKKALVIDSMNGYENVKEVARRYTDLPLVLVNTHGHPDHIFGNYAFEEAYMNLKDEKLAESFINGPEFSEIKEKNNLIMPPFKDIHEGDLIDLGGKTIKIYDIPGHTKGGILLLLVEDRILFTGDSINHHLWMQLPDCISISNSVMPYERLLFLEKEADVILHGHAHDYDDISLLRCVTEGLKEIADGNVSEDSDYNWFGGVGKQHPFKVVEGRHYQQDDHVICYDPNNL